MASARQTKLTEQHVIGLRGVFERNENGGQAARALSQRGDQQVDLSEPRRSTVSSVWRIRGNKTHAVPLRKSSNAAIAHSQNNTATTTVMSGSEAKSLREENTTSVTHTAALISNMAAE